MTFPTVQDGDTKNGTQTSNSTSWTGTYPTNIASGDLLLMFVASDGNPAVTSTGWTQVGTDAVSACNVNCLAKIAAGTETGTFTISVSASEQGAWRIFRITGWFGSGLPTSNNAHDGAGVDSAGALGGASSTPDPPNLDPGQWATEDTLWFATCGVDTSRTISVFPLADRNSSDVSGGAGGATLGLCSTNSAVSSLNPGTFTISTSDDWGALTVAVRPAAAVERVPYFAPYVQILPQ